VAEGPISSAARRCPVLPNWNIRKSGECKRFHLCSSKRHKQCSEHRGFYFWRGEPYPVKVFLSERKRRLPDYILYIPPWQYCQDPDRPTEVFFPDPKKEHPLSLHTSLVICYNISAMMPSAPLWFSIITREWLYWVACYRCGYDIDDRIIRELMKQ